MLPMNWLSACAAIMLSCSCVVEAAAPVTPQPATGSSATDEILRASVLEITRGPDGKFTGAGWDRLIADTREAQFTLIGEQHAAADLANFETEVFRAIASLGYSHAALEVGPISTIFAEGLIRSGKGKLGSFLAAPGHGFALPFLFFAEETTMAEEIVARSSDRKEALWGLDQEFVGAMPILAPMLVAKATTPRQREVAANLVTRADADPMLLPALSETELEQLASTFEANRPASEIVDAIRISHAIYQPFIKGGPAQPANLRRETYMKDNFLRLFTATERRLGKAPKVFLKFGGYHAMRGMSGTDVPALGNFLAEWGHSRGFGLVNIMADCVSGRVVNPRDGESAPCEPYIGKASTLHRIAASGTSPIAMLDLKPLRSRLGAMRDLDANSRQTILAFDYYIAFKDVVPSTPLGAIAKP